MKPGSLILAFAFAAYPLFGEDKPMDDIHVSISEHESGSHLLSGGFSVSASTDVVWEVLTDYDGMARFVSSIKSSRRVESEKDHQVVEQVMSGKAGFFRKRIHLRLEVQEQPSEKISFKDLSKKSFKVYSGFWEIHPQDELVHVKYQLEARPDFFSPDFIALKAFKNTVRILLIEVRDEIILRKERENKSS